jgi:hypothetical protein
MKALCLCVLLLLSLAACSEGAQLDLDATLAAVPTTAVPSVLLSGVLPEGSPQPTSENIAPLSLVTQEAQYIIITPTLPPSKTPTQTPSSTPPQTPTPTFPVTATATMQLFPTRAATQAVTAAVAESIPLVCDSSWFFLDPRPASCPVNEALGTQAVYQPFEAGFMIWIEQQDLIYVFYNSFDGVAWEVYPDEYEEWMPEVDPTWPEEPPRDYYHPRRGYGMLWRSQPEVRSRIGWAMTAWEEWYTIQVQAAEDGTVFLADPRGNVISLAPNGTEWQRYMRAIR